MMTRTRRPVRRSGRTPLDLLAGPGRELVATAVSAAGGELREWRPSQVTLHPGRSMTIRYETVVTWSSAGRPQRETFVAQAGARLPHGTARLRGRDGAEVALWRYPDDPELPALGAALDPLRVAGLVADLGAATSPDGVRLQLRAYRPGRRAVIAVAFPAGRLFVKVVPPRHAARLHRRHRLRSATMPVPDSLGFTDDGLVVLAAIDGRTLRAALGSNDDPLVAGGAVLDLLDRLPAALAAETPARGSSATA